MRKNCNHEKNRPLCAYVRSLVSPEWLDGFYLYLTFQEFIHQCVVNMSIPAPKAEALLRDPQRENCDCLEMAPIILIQFLTIYGNHLLNKTAKVVSSGK